tara:strand:- start:555 stop:1547 length:993 start_codon:yes stop_codon:yes gene_type:complete
VSKNLLKAIHFINKPSQEGGPGTFLTNFIEMLNKKKIDYWFYRNGPKPKIIFVLSGTINKLHWLIYQKLRGAKIIQRVDGHFWQHNYISRGAKDYLYSNLVNANIKFIMRFLADKIIYQSTYVKKVWKKVNVKNKDTYIILNYSKKIIKRKINQKSNIKLICVEGNFDNVFNMENHLNLIKDYTIYLYGDCSVETKKKLQKIKNVKYMGSRKREKILKIYNSNEKIIYLNLEFCAAGSNSVIEAMSHSVPIIGFKTGCMKEFVNKESGILIDYKIKNFSNMKYLKNLKIEKKIKDIEKKYIYYSNGAYKTAKKIFYKDKNFLSYIDAIYN